MRQVCLIHRAAYGGVCRKCVFVRRGSPKLFGFKHFASFAMIIRNTSMDTFLANVVSKRITWNLVDNKLTLTYFFFVKSFNLNPLYQRD